MLRDITSGATCIPPVIASTLVLGGCSYATLGNLLVLFVTLALFCGTLSLGRAESEGKPSEPRDGDTLQP